jgi:RNA polymerase sigma factor (sigma-70 family)
MERRGVSAQFRNGDPDAVREIYRQYGRLVYAVAHRVLGDRDLAEEATQQAFLKAWRGAGSLHPDRELGPWLASIARRAAIDVSRHQAVRAVDPIESVASGDPGLATRPESVEASHDVWAVREAVAGLPAQEREIVRLQHLRGLTLDEISEKLNMPVATVRSRSLRAHRRLAAVLGHLRQ